MRVCKCLLFLVFLAVSSSWASDEVELVWAYRPAEGNIDASAAIADLDGAEGLEIALVSTGGEVAVLGTDGELRWRREFPGPLVTSPTAADVAPAAGAELLVLNPDGRLFCLEGATGNTLWEWAFPGGVGRGYTAVAAGDLDGDGLQDIVAGDNRGSVACLDGQGRLEWIYQGDHGGTLCPAIADGDGDGRMEVWFGGTRTPLMCLNSDGTARWAWDCRARGASPVAADLDGDGKMEIVGAADNQLAAFSWDGTRYWTQPLHRELDSAISAADLDGDGLLEVLAADLSGYLVCVSYSGVLLWEADVEGWVRRSPSVGDVDGDGQPEVLVAGDSGMVHVFGAKGKLEARIRMGGPLNGTAALFPLEPDGPLHMLCAVSGVAAKLFRWKAALPHVRALWPDYRGDARRQGAAPRKIPASEERLDVVCDYGHRYVGLNTFRIQVDNPEQRRLDVLIEVQRGTEPAVVQRRKSAKAVIEEALNYIVSAERPSDFVFRYTVSEGGRTLTQGAQRFPVTPFRREMEDTEQALHELEQAADRLADPIEVERRTALWRSWFEQTQTEWPGLTMAGPDALRAFEARAAKMCLESTHFSDTIQGAIQLNTPEHGCFAVRACNPWAPFGGIDELGEGRLGDDTVRIEAFQGEVESGAVAVYNLGSVPRTFRVEVFPADEGDALLTLPPSALDLHEVVAVPSQSRDLSADALPRMNQGRTLAVAPWEARQVWIGLGTQGLVPGDYGASIRFMSEDNQAFEAAIPVRVHVWETALPQEQPLRLCLWGYVQQSVLKDQPEAALADQVAHGANVFVGLFYPKAQYDESGAIVGDIDFTDHDAYVKRHAPHGMILFYCYQEALTGPGDMQSEAYRKAHVQWLRAWAAHLKALGVDYSGWALYPVDEPGLYGDSELFERFLYCAKLAHEADPNILLYANPMRTITDEELRAMQPYVDIWCPNRRGLLAPAEKEKLDLIRANGKPVWTYESWHNAKLASPLGYYRGQAWLAQKLGLTGIGFWSYCTSSDDPWIRPASGNDYLLIYQGEGVVSSKRWEAIRDGVEDYSMLHRLAQAIKAKQGQPGNDALCREAEAFLREAVPPIAAFCDLAQDGTTTVLRYGAPQARVVEDRHWVLLQETRRTLAGLLQRMQ